jgi:D-inositol-3-phosphate glycosyltransferase
MVSMHTSPAQQPGTGDSGGMNVAVLASASSLAERGIEVELLTRATGEPAVTELVPGVTLFELPAGTYGPLDKQSLAAVSDEFGEAVATLAGRKSARYDVIHAHYWLSGIATLPVAIELGLPFVQSFHTLAAMKGREAGAVEPERRRHAEAYLATQSTAVIANSAAEATSLIDEVGTPTDRVWVVPPGVDVDLFRPNRSDAGERVRSELGIEAGRPILAVVGRIQPLKDQALALEALAELRAMRGWSPVLVIAGEPTPGDEAYASGLRSLAADLGIADDVRFVGAVQRNRLADLLATATLTLVPSHSETFGIVALESAASGTPVVAFRASGLVESVSDGHSGLLVDSRTPRDWANAIDGLLVDPQALGRLSAGARDHALGFTWAASTSALLDVYRAIIEL